MSRLTRKLQELGMRDKRGMPNLFESMAGPEDLVCPPDAGPIVKLFHEHDGYLVHKWLHFLPLYERYFEPYRQRKGAPLRFLEIGVSKGGSMQIWRRYFGDDAIIFGIDIDEECRKLDKVSGGEVRIGSQADEAFLKEVVLEMGGVDIVLDDGSHMMSHINKSFEVLFPLLADGGLYVAEDLQCAYWPHFEGGLRKRGSFIETAKKLVDDMHHWWHEKPCAFENMRNQIAAVHFHQSMVFVEKDDCSKKPVHTMRGEEPK